MANITEILRKYTCGTVNADETNKALKDAGASFHIIPGKNELTQEEIAASHAETAGTAAGFGLLDTGTGSLDKAQAKDGKLVDADCGEMYALFIIAGKTFHVKGSVLEA